MMARIDMTIFTPFQIVLSVLYISLGIVVILLRVYLFIKIK